MKGFGRGKKLLQGDKRYLGDGERDSANPSPSSPEFTPSGGESESSSSGLGLSSETSLAQNKLNSSEPLAVVRPGRGAGRGLFRPPPAEAHTYQPAFSPYPLICGPQRPLESILPFDIEAEADAPLTPEEEMVLKIRRLNAGLTLGRGRGRVVRRATVVSSDESEDNVFRPRGISSTFGLHSPSISTPLPSSSPSLSLTSTSSDSAASDTVVKRGEKGTIVPIAANYIWLSVEKNKGIFQYHVDFNPPFENMRVKRLMLREHESILGQVRNFDGVKLYLPFKLPDQTTELESFNPNDSTTRVKLSIKYITPKKTGAYMRDYVQFCNILFRRIMTILGLVNINRQFFNMQMDAILRLPNHKLEIWPGYVTAIDEREGGLMLCCDASFRVLRTETMLDIWKSTQFAGRRNSQIDPKEAYKNYLVGKIVLTRYNNRNYRIDDVDYTKTPLSTFDCRGEQVTFAAYYLSQYSIRIHDLEQPLLFHLPRPRKNDPRQITQGPTLLIPELCYMTGLSEDLRENHRVMKDISSSSRLTPQQRNTRLETFISQVNSNEEASKILKDWGLKLDNCTAKLEGRVIGENLEVVMNSKHSFTLKSRNYDFALDTKQHACYEPVAVKDWAVFCHAREKGIADTMISKYVDVCRKLGIMVKPGNLIVINGNRYDDYRQAITGVLNKSRDLQFFTVIMARRQDDLYGMIKKLCCVDRPIPSQIILAKSLSDPRKIHAIMSKIALQINCKIGGALWTIRLPRVEKIMFVGMDVYHDPRQKSSSVTALVASLNDIHTKYFSKIIRQRAHQETMASLRPLFMEALKEFYGVNNCWPDRILVFRDGIGDGELETTRQVEVVQLTESIRNLCENSPKFTYTVVQKRIHTRIFAKDRKTETYINPVPGTVLDHTVTRRVYFDFFLVSQLIHEGTVNPTHYIVLEDNSDIAPDLMQKFAFATSFMYFNWAGSIRVPAVCQYAHKLAYLVGQYLHCDPSDVLNKQLYYL